MLSLALLTSTLVQSYGPHVVSSKAGSEYAMKSWTLTSSDFTVELEVNKEAKWVGFGLGEEGAGAMAGADIVLCDMTTGAWACTDSYALSESRPSTDAQQDWTLVSSATTSTSTILTLQRATDTGDAGQDRMIKHDHPLPQPLIFAMGTSDAVQYHGADNRWRQKVKLAGGQSEAGLMADLDTAAADVFDMRNPDLALDPTQQTIYHDTYYRFDEGVGSVLKDRLVIGLAGVHTTKYVHHFTVYGFEDSGQEEMLYAWAPGSQPFVLPAEVGINMANYDGIKIQTHFDNPNLDSGIVDTSGVRFYVAAKGATRPMEYGVLQLGDPALVLGGSPLKSGLSTYTFTCPSLESTAPITIYNHLLHMHSIGVRMVTEHLRGGTQVGGSQIEHYDFDYQDMTYRNEVANPGDSFVTTCFYDTSKAKTGSASFGLGSDDEMCIDFVGYWPRDAIPQNRQFCGLNAHGQLTQSGNIEAVGRKFGAAGQTIITIPTLDELPPLINNNGGEGNQNSGPVPEWCSACRAASGCFEAGPAGGCDAASGELHFEGGWDACRGDGEGCAPCFPDSPCYKEDGESVDECALCDAAVGCFEVPDGCDASTGEHIFVDDFAACQAAVGPCAACFPDSPCAKKTLTAQKDEEEGVPEGGELESSAISVASSVAAIMLAVISAFI